jgi:hypothetical protein
MPPATAVVVTVAALQREKRAVEDIPSSMSEMS